MHKLFTIATNIQGTVLCERSSLKLLNKILEKYLRKSSFLVKLQVLKMNSFTRIFKVSAKSLSNLVHDFWENCFRTPKLLLAASRLIYLNTLKGISKIHGPWPPPAP